VSAPVLPVDESVVGLVGASDRACGSAMGLWCAYSARDRVASQRTFQLVAPDQGAYTRITGFAGQEAREGIVLGIAEIDVERRRRVVGNRNPISFQQRFVTTSACSLRYANARTFRSAGS